MASVMDKLMEWHHVRGNIVIIFASLSTNERYMNNTLGMNLMKICASFE